MKQLIFTVLLITAIQALGQPETRSSAAKPEIRADAYTIFLTSFKKYLEVGNPTILAEWPTCGTDASIPKDPHDFTKEHLTILAHNKIGSGYIDGLSVLEKRALELKTDENGTPIVGANGKPQFKDEAVNSATALMLVKPKSMNLVQFIQAIDDVASQTVDIRYQLDVERIKAQNKLHPDKPLKFPKRGSSTYGAELTPEAKSN